MNVITPAPRLYPQQEQDVPNGHTWQAYQKGIEVINKAALLIMQSHLTAAVANVFCRIIVLASTTASRVMDLIRQLVAFTLNLVAESSPSAGAALQNVEDLPPSRHLNVHEMSPEALQAVFDQLAMQNLNDLQGLSEEIMELVKQPALWELWAEQLYIPIKMGESPRAKITSLLTYFAIDPSTGTATLLKNIENVKVALEIYPTPAWIIQPIANSSRLHFYCRNLSGQYIEYLDVDKDVFHSEQTQEVNRITEDENYTYLKLLAL